jgi:hypothetical protein
MGVHEDRKKHQGRYDETSPRIGIHKWELNAISSGETFTKLEGFLEDIVAEALCEAMEVAVQEYSCDWWFEYEPAAVIVSVGLPLGASDFENPRWKFNLSQIVDFEIEMNEIFEGGPIVDGRGELETLKCHFRDLADRIEHALARTDDRE